MAHYLEMATRCTYEIANENLNAIIEERGILENKYSTDNVNTGQMLKDEYLDFAKRINSYCNSQAQVPTYGLCSLGYPGWPTMVYMYSRILRFYHENQALPNYVNVSKWTGATPVTETSTKSSFHQAVEKAVSSYSTFTEYYNKIKAKTWKGYYNDIYSQSEEIQRLANNQYLNCTDHSQLGFAVAQDLGYDAVYCRVTCKSGGHITLKVKGKELGSNWVNVDLAAAAQSSYNLGSYWCSSYAKPVVIDESWLNSDDGKT